MKRTIAIMGLLIAALCAWVLYSRYGSFMLAGTESPHPERGLYMFGALGLIALVMSFAVTRK